VLELFGVWAEKKFIFYSSEAIGSMGEKDSGMLDILIRYQLIWIFLSNLLNIHIRYQIYKRDFFFKSENVFEKKKFSKKYWTFFLKKRSVTFFEKKLWNCFLNQNFFREKIRELFSGNFFGKCRSWNCTLIFSCLLKFIG
jgi:hypothetical protein